MDFFDKKQVSKPFIFFYQLNLLLLAELHHKLQYLWVYTIYFVQHRRLMQINY